jgi:type II secretory pathway pseudopilin PulG
MSSNLQWSGTTRITSDTQKNNSFSAFSLVELLVILAVCAMLLAMLLPATQRAREGARLDACLDNLRQVMLATFNYESKLGTLPPAFTVNPAGERLQSWRTLLLPQLGRQDLFDIVDQSQPWDAPVNAAARDTALHLYTCPSFDGPITQTTYLGLVGPASAFLGSEPRKLPASRAIRKKTVYLVDAVAGDAVPWMAPKDTDQETVLAYGPETRTNHPGVIHTAFFDGHIEPVLLDIDREVLRGMLNLDEGEVNEVVKE